MKQRTEGRRPVPATALAGILLRAGREARLSPPFQYNISCRSKGESPPGAGLAPPPRSHLSKRLRLCLRLRLRPGHPLHQWRPPPSGVLGEVPPLGGARGGARRREGLSSGSVCRGRSGRRAALRELCGVLVATEVGEGPGGLRGAGRTAQAKPGVGQWGCAAGGPDS